MKILALLFGLWCLAVWGWKLYADWRWPLEEIDEERQDG